VGPPTELRQTLARNIRAALARHGRTVVALADFAGVSTAHLYDVLGCKKAATVDFIQKVSEALDCEAADLLRAPDREVAAAPADAESKHASPGKREASRRR
jgi:DNA-binding Xre family transcriptional regulator